MLKRQLLVRGLLLACFVLAPCAGAQEPDLGSLSVEELLDLSVSIASNVATELGQQPSSITVIGRRQIELSAARTLNELLMTYVPGYFLTEDQDDVIAGFRGFSADNNSKVLLLLNGHSLNAEWFWGPADAVLNGMGLDYVDHVEVIRGPGSVVLGAGALLGSINVVTKTAADGESSLTGGAGRAGQLAGAVQGRLGAGGTLKGYVYAATGAYDGEPMRNEGWARDKFDQGLSVYERDHHLKRSRNRTFLLQGENQGLDFTLFATSQLRDLYNFYRDREEVEQSLLSAAAQYRTKLSEKLNLRLRLSFDVDDYALSSHDGVTTGGTRELRQGFSALVASDTLVRGHRLAAGVEVSASESGRENLHHDNFLVNLKSLATDDVNRNHTWAYPSTTLVYSVFAEDLVRLAEKLQAFGAFRIDHHPNWGGRLTPRLGLIYQAAEPLRLRASWQTGFRGAVGVHYSGGFRGDGLIHEESLDKIEANPLLSSLGFKNESVTKPEEMSSVELAGTYTKGPFTVDATGFYNHAKNVIDVGVLYVDPAVASLQGQSVGGDVAGSWNGFFYFKNSRGAIDEVGAEVSVRYRIGALDASVSHSLVRVTSADADQLRGSMYLAGTPTSPHFKAYPEDVTRINVMLTPKGRVSAALNYLHYGGWYTPRDSRMPGSHLLNGGIRVRVLERLSVDLLLKNILDRTDLYPMNNNASDATLAAGTPAVEGRTYWLAVKWRL